RIPLPSFQAHRLMVDTFLRRSGLGVAKPLIALHPGAGWPTKRWGEEKYARLGDALALRTGAQVIITWGPGDEGVASRVRALMSSEARLTPALTLPQLACLLEHCIMFIGGDTGPLHLAAAMGVPVLGIYGPTTPWRNGPFGVEHAVLYRPLPCSGCHKRSCEDPICILSLTVQEALEAALELWGRVRERWRGRRVLEG
ncbi:MAG: glycosyltransferase family 9 protein, partial [Nitrospinota bacterium]